MSPDAETAPPETEPPDDPAAARRPGTTFGPGGHPTGGLRPYLAALLVVGGLLAVPIMLSDRAPGFFDRITDRMEESFPDVWWSDVKPFVPEPDVAMHLVFFGGLAFVIGLLAWSWRSFVVGQLGVLAVGFVLEFAQPVFTSSRNVEVHDIVSNMTGQAMGIAAALLCIWLLRWRRRSVGGALSR